MSTCSEVSTPSAITVNPSWRAIAIIAAQIVGAVIALFEVHHKRTIDLQRIDWKAPQIA